MIREAIAKVVQMENLNEAEMMEVMDEVMEGQATPAQIAALITALRIKGETIAEVTGAARIMRQKATRIDARSPHLVENGEHVGERAHDDVGPEIGDELGLALGHAAGDRRHHAAGGRREIRSRSAAHIPRRSPVPH